MRKILACLTVLLFFGVALATPFSDGWCDGYKAGYCYGKTFCLGPICPIAPIPWVGQDTYQDGYNRGFVKGLEAAK
jgi:hypothetical protein